MRRQPVFRLALTFMMLSLVQGAVFADAITESIVEEFNNLNYYRGYLFQTQTVSSPEYFDAGYNSGEIRLLNRGTPGNVPSLSGYNIGLTANNGSGTGFYFQTFCVEPNYALTDTELNVGSLFYDHATNTTRTSYDNPLTLGVAFLYKKFADGSLSGYDYAFGSSRTQNAVELQDAIWFLMSRESFMIDGTTNWGNNTFLDFLLTINSDQSFWAAAYDPANDYSGLMEGAKVFVMHSTLGSWARSVGDPRQDVLYVINPGNDVPEPTTALLWALGSLGSACVAYKRRKFQRKS